MTSVWFPPTPAVVITQDKKKKYEPPVPTRVGKKKKKTKGPDAASKLPLGKDMVLPAVFPIIDSVYVA